MESKVEEQKSNYNKLAIISLILPFIPALLSILLVFSIKQQIRINILLVGLWVIFIFSIIALIIGLIAVKQIRERKEKGIVIAVLAILLNISIIVYFVILLLSPTPIRPGG